MDLKQMKRISIIWGVLLLLIVIGLTIVGFVYKSKASSYKQLENDLVSVTEKYVEAKFLYPSENQSINIYLSELQEDGYIESLKKDNDECDGYVKLYHDGFAYQFKGYITCPKYTTQGYEKLGR